RAVDALCTRACDGGSTSRGWRVREREPDGSVGPPARRVASLDVLRTACRCAKTPPARRVRPCPNPPPSPPGEGTSPSGSEVFRGTRDEHPLHVAARWRINS